MDAFSKYILKMGGYCTTLLRLDAEYKHDPDMKLKDFIAWLISTGGGFDSYNTTYLNGRLQCQAGAVRSLGDIYRVCAYYYPGTTIVDVRRYLRVLGPKGHFCSDVQRRIYGLYGMWDPYNHSERDEFGFPIRYYKNSRLRGGTGTTRTKTEQWYRTRM